MKRVVILVFGLLASCSYSSLDTVADGLQLLKGRPIETAVAKLGRPDSQQVVMNETAYVWWLSFDAQVSGAAMAPVAASTCRVRVFTLQGDPIITHGDVEGNEKACAHYARLF